MRTIHWLIALTVLLGMFSLTPKASAHLNPALGRFMQLDSLAYADGVNRYEYSKDRPTYLADPYGFQATQPPTTATSQPHKHCVYRGDNRCPDWKYPAGKSKDKTIGDVGLLTWADSTNAKPNLSITAHQRGDSQGGNGTGLGSHDDGFISFTTDEGIAQLFAIEGKKNGDCTGCVYKICSDDDDAFWKRAKTPDEWGKDPTYLLPQEKPGRDDSLRGYDWEAEVTVLGSISPNVIAEVYPVKSKDCCDQSKQPAGKPVTIPEHRGHTSATNIYTYEPIPLKAP